MIHTQTDLPVVSFWKQARTRKMLKRKDSEDKSWSASYRIGLSLFYLIWLYDVISSHPILSYLTDLCSRAGWRWAVELSSQRTWLQRSFRDCGQESGNIVPKNSLIIIVTVKMARHGNIFRIYLIFRRKGTAVVHISTVSFLINNYQTHANLSSLNAMKIGHQPRKMVT